MCYQKRLVYGTCNHSAPLGLAGSCLDSEECDGTRAHPLQTVRVERMCPACGERKAKESGAIASLRERVKALREDLARKGFVGRDGKKGGEAAGAGDGEEGGCASGSGSGSAASSSVEKDDMSASSAAPSTASPTKESQTVARPGADMASDGAASSSPEPCTMPRLSPLTRRNDMFVGGVCLSSTSLMTISGKRLL